MNIVNFPKPNLPVWGVCYWGFTAAFVWGSFLYGHWADPVTRFSIIAFGALANILFIWEGVLYVLTISVVRRVVRSLIIQWRVAKFRRQYGMPPMPWDVFTADEMRQMTEE